MRVPEWGESDAGGDSCGGGGRVMRKWRKWGGLGAALACLLSGAGALDAQDVPLLERPARLDVRDVSVEEGLRALQLRSGVAMAYSPDLLPPDVRVDCACSDVTVAEALDHLLLGTGLTYSEGRRQVLVGRARRPGPTGSTLVGTVVESGNGRPIAAAEVVVSGGRSVLSGDDGRFVLSGLRGSDISVTVRALGYRSARRDVSVRGVDALRLELDRAPIPLSEIVIAPGSFGVLEVTPSAAGVTVSREEIEAIPQFGDDVFRTLKRMPGVSTDDVSTRLSVRGGTPRDVLVRLDGLELFEPYHLKDLDGALGIVDVQSLGSVDLLTGGFPVEFGDKSAAIFDMHTRRPPSVGTRTTLGMSLSSLSAISQGTFAADRGQWLTSLRRGFLEYVLAVTNVDDDLSPSYWDVLTRVQYLLSDHHSLSAQLLWAGDDMRWRDAETASMVNSTWSNGYGWLTWKGVLRERVHAETVLSAGRLTRDRAGSAVNPDRGEFTPLSSAVRDEATVDFTAIRQDLSVELAREVLLKFGVEVRRSSASYDYYGAATRWALDDQDRLIRAGDTTTVEVSPSGDELAGWAALRGRGGPLTWEGGIRYDRYSLTDEDRWSPRVLVRWDPGPSTSVKASVGGYAQSQGIHELQSQDGQDSFDPAAVARQSAFGVEHRFSQGWAVRAEAYLRRVARPLPEWVNLSRAVNPIPEVESDRRRIAGDRARAHGVELLLSREGTGGPSWSASYALAWSDIFLDGIWRPRTLDQRHTLNLAGAWRFGSSWQLSGSWQYHTGWPFTDQMLDVVVAQAPEGPESIDVLRRGFGELNADRLPAYHRLDLRVTRAFTFERSRLELFLDVFNVYDRTNLRGWQWSLRSNGDGSYRAVKDTGEEQLPIMPTIGFRWVF
jgi:hypothetical protein